MFSPQLLDHFANPRNAGELPPPALAVEVSNPGCGDVLRFYVRFENGRVAEARFQARGCTALIAAASVLAERVPGMEISELAALNARDVEERLGGVPAESKHAPSLCIDAVRAVLKAAS